MRTIFIAHSLKFADKALAYEASQKLMGNTCYVPARDTPQTCGDEIIICNRNAMERSDECHVIWDGVSLGTLVDIGMAYGLRKPVKIIDIIPQSWTTYLQTKIGEYLK